MRRPPPNTHAQLVSDWVEVFAPVLRASRAPTAWPKTVVPDAGPVTYARRGGGTATAFTALAAMGYDAHHRPYVGATEAVPAATKMASKELLISMSGAPTWVVTDGGQSELAAISYARRPT